ncbi:MAG: hypothetical protein CMQ29_02590, partial [Gammaproteobacteria bacterium]|nr:hypothetical protein [Gammaproteobacteria bacterium]
SEQECNLRLRTLACVGRTNRHLIYRRTALKQSGAHRGASGERQEQQRFLPCGSGFSGNHCITQGSGL